MSESVLGKPVRQALTEIGRRQDRRGWVPATAGNLSAREAGAEHVWITASGTHKGRLEPDDFLLVDLDGTVLQAAEGRRPSAETSLHLAVYRSVPDAQACLHVHTLANTLVHRLGLRSGAAVGQDTQPVEGDFVELPPLELVKAFGVWDPSPRVGVPVFENHPSVPDIAAEVSARFERALPPAPGFLIADHGLTAWGSDLERADYALEAFEFLFRAKLELRRLGLEARD